MTPRAPRLQDLFPDAPADLPLRVNEVRPAPYRAVPSWALALLAAGVVAAGAIQAVLLPAGELGLAALLALAVIGGAVFVAGWGTLRAHAADAPAPDGAPDDRMMQWGAWCQSRGLQPGAPRDATLVLENGETTPLPMLRCKGTSGTHLRRTGVRLASGALGRDRTAVTVASLDLLVPEDVQAHHWVVETRLFVLARLPKGAAAVYAGSALERRRDARRVDSFGTGGRLVTDTESHDFNRNCTLRVYGDPKLLQWQELLHPAFIDELANHRDVQWQQLGEWLCVPVGTADANVAPSRRLDTACANARWLVEQFTRAAAGDVPGASLRAA